MRNLSVALAISLVTAAAWADSPKPHPVDVAPGRVAWFNLPDGTGAVGLVADPVGHPVGMYSRAAIASTTPAAR